MQGENWHVPQGTTRVSRSELTDWIRERVAESRPAAVVRFGDGEAQMLTADANDAESMRLALRRLKRQAGLNFSPEVVFDVQKLVSTAFDGADVLGIRYYPIFSEESKKWLDKLSALYAERLSAGRAPALLGHCLMDWEPLPSVLAGRRISVISCRDVKPVLESSWRADDVVVYQVPSQHAARDVDGAYESRMHGIPIWPDIHARVCKEIRVRERGEVFLVGAGVFGKDLCVRVRDQGGIALDMGSALDRLAGKITRGPSRRALELHRRGMSVDEIAADFRQFYRVTVERDRVVRILEKLSAANLT